MDRGGRVALEVDADGIGTALGEPACVCLVIDRELPRVSEPLCLRAQDPRAGRVEGHQPHAAGTPAKQPLHPSAHLLGRLVGERDREDLARLGLVGIDQERDPVREHARLAAAGAREDQQRPLAVGDGLTLGLVEVLEQLLQVFGVGIDRHLLSIEVGSAGRAPRSESRPAASQPLLARRAGTRQARALVRLSRRPGWDPSRVAAAAPRRPARRARARARRCSSPGR